MLATGRRTSGMLNRISSKGVPTCGNFDRFGVGSACCRGSRVGLTISGRGWCVEGGGGRKDGTRTVMLSYDSRLQVVIAYDQWSAIENRATRGYGGWEMSVECRSVSRVLCSFDW